MGEAAEAVAAAGGDQRVELLALDFSPFMKATPREEGGHRFIYCEAANEAWDQEKERILKSALWDSRQLFLDKGNIDIGHLSIVGHQLGLANPDEWEIGLPVEVKDGPNGIFVKGEIYKGDGTTKADWWWATQTKQTPPMRWFPSVAGWPEEKRTIFDAATRRHRSVITKAKWRGLGFAKEAQNLSLPVVSLTPVGEFIKAVQFALAQPACVGEHCVCAEAGGCEGDAPTLKAMTAGYGTDVSALTGGGALRVQSHEGRVIHPWVMAGARYLKALGTGSCAHTRAPITREKIADHFAECEGLSRDDAAAATHRLLRRVRRRATAAAA